MDIEKIKKTLGQQIRTFRIHNNYSQEQFCEIIGLEQPNLSNIENGKNLPDISTLFSIIEKGQMEPNLLLGFLNNKSHYSVTDSEIMALLLNLSEESKVRIKNLIEIVK